MSMVQMSRRELIQRAGVQSGAFAILAAAGADARANPLGLPIGSQTWPTRSMLTDSPAYVKVKAAADEYNKIAAVAAKSGIQQGLHNEGFEVSVIDGKKTYDVLLELLDPKLVKFQFQMSTITNGFVAADYFVKYPGRFFSMHL